MSMTEDEIDLLRESFRLMQTRKGRAAEVFYEHLFDIDPTLRRLFTTDLSELTEKVMIAMGAVIGQMQDLENCNAMTLDLAKRHVGYGVKPEDYEKVGHAVFRTLSEALEDDYTDDMDRAWRKAYAAIADAMIQSAYSASV